MANTFSAAALAVVALSAMSAAQAKNYSDPAGRFKLKLPSGWEQAEASNPQLAFAAAKVSEGALAGLCVVIITDAPKTSTKSQSEIDAQMSQDLTKEYWRLAYEAQGMKGVMVEDNGVRSVNGRKVHFAIATSLVKIGTNPEVAMKSREEVHALPGSVHDVGCVVQREKFAATDPDFMALMNSYEPRSGLITQGPQNPNSVLTLYADSGFAGATKVITGDTPDVTAIGWSNLTGSMSIAGFGEWQICEGANYAGRCSVTAGVRTTTPNALMPIGSLRRFAAPDSTRGLLNAVSSSTGLALTIAASKAH